MNWYYVQEGRQVGPVTEEQFQALVANGTIQTTTYVWYQGMANWQPYNQVVNPTPAAADTQTTCSQCGKVHATQDMIRHGELWICATCKPVFVQRLKEGVALPGVRKYGGFWIRFLARILDGLIAGIVSWALMLAFFPTFLNAAQAPEEISLEIIGLQLLFSLFQFGMSGAYETIFIGRFGATPGKMACGLSVTRPDGAKLSYARALGRYFGVILSYFTLYIGFIIAAFDEEKRALHDRICDTRVIKK